MAPNRMKYKVTFIDEFGGVTTDTYADIEIDHVAMIEAITLFLQTYNGQVQIIATDE